MLIMIVYLIYFVILNLLLMMTGYLSLKIIKITIGRNIKDQFNRKFFKKVICVTALSYLISIMVLVFFACFTSDDVHFGPNIDSWIFIFLALIFGIVNGPYITESDVPIFYDFDYIMPVLIILLLLTFIVSVIFNYFIIFKKFDLTKSKRFCASLIVSAMTAPYFYFVPFGGLF